MSEESYRIRYKSHGILTSHYSEEGLTLLCAKLCEKALDIVIEMYRNIHKFPLFNNILHTVAELLIDLMISMIFELLTKCCIDHCFKQL